MKKILMILSLCGFVNSLNAAPFEILADIGQVRYYEDSSSAYGSWKGHMWFSLKNPNLVPDNCGQHWGEIMVAIPGSDAASLNMVLASKMSKQKVIVMLDDTSKINGACKLQYITLPSN